MHNDPIRSARRQAKEMAKAGAASHQKALDEIARRNGHGTWSAMLVANNIPTERDEEVATNAPKPTWRITILQRIEGSRHSGLHEWGIRTIGRSIVKACKILGIHPKTLGAILPYVGLACILVSKQHDAMDVLFPAGMLLTIFPMMTITLRNPDSTASRGCRNIAWSIFAFAMAMTACLMMTDLWQNRASNGRIGTTPAQEFVFVECSIPAIICAMSLWGCAWEGRRLRRAGIQSEPRETTIPK